MGKRHEKLSRIDRIVNRCMWGISIISGICLVITAVLCTCDALLSKFFSVSIPNGTEWVTYLNIPVVFFAMAYIQIDRGHTTVDLLCSKFPQKVQKVIKVVGDVLGTVMTSSECDLEEIKRDFHDVFSFSDEPVPERTAVLKIIRSE